MHVLALGSGYTNARDAGAVRALQRRLASLGYSPGPIDGRYGPLTQHAAIRFQATHGLVADGIDGPLTTSALASAKLVLRPGDGFAPGGSKVVKALQRHLAAVGFRSGPIDGRYGPLTERAVIRFQTARHLHADGIAGPETLGLLQREAQRQVRSRPQPRTAAPRARKRVRPSRPRATGARPHAVGHHATHSRGPSLVPWLIALACVMLAMLAWLLWHGRRSRDSGSQVAVLADSDHGSATYRGAAAGDEQPDAAARVSEHSQPVAGPASIDGGDSRQEPRRNRLEPDPGHAAFKLAGPLTEAGNLAGAEDAFRRADRRGHPTDVAGAEAAFGRAAEGGDVDAAFNLGVLLEHRGDLAGALLAFQRADQRGHARAAFNLGVLLVDAGDLARAEEAFGRADERGDADAACNLGVLLEHRGDLTGAQLAYQRADERGHAVAAWNLGSLLEQHGDRAGAKAAYQRADERGLTPSRMPDTSQQAW